MKATFTVGNLEFSFTDADVTNLDSHVPAGEYNPHNIHPWLLHDHGFTLCVVFASNLQDAIDEAVDENKLERYLISEVDSIDYHDDDCASITTTPEHDNREGAFYNPSVCKVQHAWCHLSRQCGRAS